MKEDPDIANTVEPEIMIAPADLVQPRVKLEFVMKSDELY